MNIFHISHIFVAFKKIHFFKKLDLQQVKGLLSSGSQKGAKAPDWFLQRALPGANGRLLVVFASELWSRKVQRQWELFGLEFADSNS